MAEQVFMTLEPDGQAAGCNPAEVGSTPTGVSLFLDRRAEPGGQAFLQFRHELAARQDQVATRGTGIS
jgi:hypothetical protein